MFLPRINLHIHSTYSDGKNNIKQIVKKSLDLKLEYIAITDHFTDSWKAWVTSLNNHDTILEYLNEIEDCQNYLRKTGRKLRVLKGLEIDLASSENFIKQFIEIEMFDLILFEYLESLESIAFIKNIIQYWKKLKKSSKNFPILGLAHFDPSNFIYHSRESLIAFLKEYNIYFEFNSSYPQCYSLKNEFFFEKLKKNNNIVAIGSDSHHLSNLDDIEEPLEMIKYYNLEDNYRTCIEVLNSIRIT